MTFPFKFIFADDLDDKYYLMATCFNDAIKVVSQDKWSLSQGYQYI